MKKTRVAVAGAVAAFVLAGFTIPAPATAEHFGGKSRTFQFHVERIVHAWFPAGWDARMVCVIRHESGFNPLAVNFAGLVAGLFQMQWTTWSTANENVWRQPARYGWVLRFWRRRVVSFNQFRARLADPVQATRYAHMLWLSERREGRSGMGPWSYDGC